MNRPTASLLPLSPQLPLRAAFWPQRGNERAQSLVHAWLARQPELADAGIVRDAHGRPWLRDSGWDASWSHTGPALLAACGPGLRIGVDLESSRPRKRALTIAERFFHPDSTTWLRAQTDCGAAFVRLWCAHEAVLKAHGRGLAFGMARLAFAGDAQGRLRLVDCDPALGDARMWTLHALQPAPGLHAALAWRPAY